MNIVLQITPQSVLFDGSRFKHRLIACATKYIKYNFNILNLNDIIIIQIQNDQYFRENLTQKRKDLMSEFACFVSFQMING